MSDDCDECGEHPIDCRCCRKPFKNPYHVPTWLTAPPGTCNRILTLQVEIIDSHEASWIWKSHKDNSAHHGVKVKVIMEGEAPDDG